MRKYEYPAIEVIRFENEDVITRSDPENQTPEMP